MNATAYANRSRAAPARTAPQPRNMRAVDHARERDVPLVISFVGDTEWPNPTVYVDGGKRYDWSFVRGLDTIIAVRPGIDSLEAVRQILAHTDTFKGLPVVIDVEHQEVACVIEGPPVQLWQVRRGSVLWQQYFSPAP